MKNTTRFTLDMDPALQRRLKVHAALRGVTMREYCLAAIGQELDKDAKSEIATLPFGHDSLDRLAALQSEISRGRVFRGDSTEFIRRARAKRAS